MTTRVTHEALTELVDIDSLYHWRDNPRRGNVKAIKGSLGELGQYRPVIVNRGTHTGRPLEVLAGNHTVKAIRDRGWDKVSVAWVDLDDEQATKLAIADNRTGDLADYDLRLLAEVLGSLPDLDGTAYDPGDLDDILVQLDREAEAPRSAPRSGSGSSDEGGHDDPAPEQPQVGGVYQDKSVWDDRNRRIIVIDLPLAQFVWAQDRMKDLQRDGLDSNAAVILRLLEQATGSKCPTAPVDES